MEMRILYEPPRWKQGAVRAALAPAIGLALAASVFGQETGSLRAFRLRPNANASSLFRQLTSSPENTKLRAALAEEYRSRGQVGPASFHLAVATLVRGKSWVRQAAAGPRWLCPFETPRDEAAEKNVDELLRGGEWAEALSMAKAALDASAGEPKRVPDPLGAVSCRMAALWAQAAVHALIAGVPVDWSSREMAVRTLLMAIEDLGITEPVPGYELLSDYFLTVRDTASAYGALAAAREHAQKWPDSAYKRETLEDLEKRMRPFRKRLRLR